MMKASRIISLVMVIFSICIFIYEIIDLCRPLIIGSDIDMDILKDLDTNAISENYSQMDYYEYEDSRILIDKYYEYANNGSVDISVTIFSNNIYSEKAKVYKDYYKSNDVYVNTIIVEKENVNLMIVERTPEIRSKKAEKALLSFLKDLNAIG